MVQPVPRPVDELPPPNDADAERAVLSVAIAAPSRLGDSMTIAPPSMFFDRTRQRIATAVASIIGGGEQPDVARVTRWLREHSVNGQLGPAEATELSELAATPFVLNAEQHAQTIRDNYIRRERIATEQWRVQQLREAKCPVDDVNREADARLATLVSSQPEPEPAITSVATVIGRIQSSGERVPLGFAPLDELSRGGVFQDFRIFFGGAPGTFKTSQCSQLALGMAAAGWCVRWIAIDEGAEEVFVRWLQQQGIEQDVAERLDSPEAVDAAAGIGKLDIQFSESPRIDVDLHWTDGNPLRVVFIDSLQQATIEGAEGLEPRARVDAVLKAIKRLFSANRILTVATSELARGAYRNANSQDATDPIAALKESGSLEYYASILCVMRSVKDEPDLIDVQVPKVRRGGRKGAFCLRANRSRCLLEPIESDPRAEFLAHDRALDDLAMRILEVLRKHPDGMNVTAIRGSLRAEPGERGVQYSRVSAALARLRTGGAAKETSGPRRSTVWIACRNPRASESSTEND